MLIPQSLAYAQLAGLPAHYGLYAALLPPVLAAVFGSSKQLATGPVAVLSLMTASAISLYYRPGTNEYIALALLLAFCLGVLQILLGFIRLGGAVSFLSHPVVYGFTNAAALIIASTQLPKFFGISIPAYDHQYQSVIALFQKALSGIDLTTFLIGIWTILALFAFKKIRKNFPSVLTAVLITTVFSWVAKYTGPVVGHIPTGIPMLTVPPLNIPMVIELLPTVLVMGVVGFTEAISVAQAVAVKTKDRIDPNKELIGQGIANLFGSFFQSYAVSGSFSRTAVNFQSGAKSGLSSVFTGIIVLSTLLFLTKFLYFLPQVVLAAIIVYSVSSLVDLKKFRHIWQTSKHDGFAALLTFFATLFYAPHLDHGIAFGVIFSIGYYLYNNVHPHVVYLSKNQDGTLRDAKRLKLKRCENISVVRIDSQLFFANASYFENEIISDLSKNPKINDVLIIASGINSIDATGEEMLRSLWSAMKTAGKDLYFSNLKSQAVNTLDRTGLRKEIGRDHFFPGSSEAITYLLTKQNGHHTDAGYCPLEKHIKAEILIKDTTGSQLPLVNFLYKKALVRVKSFTPNHFLSQSRSQGEI